MLKAALDILATLVAFDTTSRDSNLEMIAWVEAYLAERGVEYWRVPGPDAGKANLLARIGPPTTGGVMLAGHTDVVPVDGQDWTSDPWVVTERDGRLYGRGVADMKGFIALALAQLDSPAATTLKTPLILALTYDEEVGCLGAPYLVETLPRLIPIPDLVIVGEPTSMKVVSAHKGMRTFRVTVTGREAHSSQRGQGASAIGEAVKLMSLITEMDREAAGDIADPGPFEPAGVTMTVGTVTGGTANNILARHCAFCWDLRAPQNDQADRYESRFRAEAVALDTAIKALAPEGGVEVTRLSNAPPLEQADDSAAEVFVRSLTGDNGLAGVAFVAEAGLYQRAGIPAVLCGPGSIRQAHQPDEWIELEQMQAGADFFDRLLRRLSH